VSGPDIDFARNPLLQLGLGCIGAAAFCVYARSWRDAQHLIYDIPAALATFSFIAQIVLESARGGINRFWLSRVLAVVLLTVVTSGREYLKWPISGHLTCVLAIALIQSQDGRLLGWERLLYWAPVPIVLAIRIGWFDRGQHFPTYSAVVFAFMSAAVALLPAYFWAD
jgi:hypothetical protein